MACRSGEEKPRDMGYCFSDASSAGNHQNILVTHLQSFEPAPEIYNLAAGLDMIGFQPKNLHPEAGAGGFGLTAISGSTMVSPDSSSAWNNHHHHQNRSSLIVDDPSLRCVFTCEGNERPSQGLSLSLNSSNPSSIGLQSFELRQHEDLSRFGPSSSRSVNFEQPPPQVMQEYSHVKNSKYLGPAQELLSEFCNLGINQHDGSVQRMKAAQKSGESDDDKKQPLLFSLDLLELQRRKTKLLQMLDEVDRRYKHYCDQMKGVTSSFEAVAGSGAAAVYSALASRAMSRHFRSLRDGIVKEIKATKKGMGEKDIAVAGGVKGETPRLRLLDQTLRQQKALQQMSMMENHPWRPQRGLPERSVSVLRAWLFEHFLHPYPSDVDKHILARQTGLSRSQVSNWFINARVRLWKPMVEEMYLEELKEKDAATAADENEVARQNQNNPDQKPTHDQLVRIDSECLSSIINNPDKNDVAKKSKTLENEFGSYGAMELDFSSYTAPHSSGGGGGVSLTLGLHQHGGGGLFYPRDQMEDCQTVQYSLLESENQNLQYRNLMGAQLLHDLAG
ncbi:homeobox protein BEL1 homolog [Salvia miltiorrhiza]|uniref:homeobox protein BEL1 homolog n=1 Tax=Salvia miltiorrhiza TaxID=226208 RepID=UPI0025AC11A9|nr:homeobox protein BEL1 homolog [Salvia miltiorrhiza]XP_057800047.1 homeobox protein BEL1 homolog [Salvia miltiorrhiza]XP_057800048.1 homeobox protein BEL1 homolog [Salvia miltiorrhiza]